ncbi:MAG TPA: indole-3-glycerol phosphate synthase TrpC [Phycisphaerales bacterium]|nr:indole-3-glycerol phosphate synthase TrpC [Phycisphaerales bacterium]
MSKSRTVLSTLQTIVAHKRVEAAKARINTPLETLQRRVRDGEKARNFFAAVINNRAARNNQVTKVIAEVKRKTPWGGMMVEEFDPAAIATAYEQNGAAAISCSTDEDYFGGHLGYIQQIKSAVALPVLRNDFVVDEYQIWESRAAGADAVLLIAEVLPEGELLDMMILSRELGMTTLVEAHETEQLLKVRPHIGFPHAGYSLLGINNRAQQSAAADINHTLRLVDLVEDRHVLVSESGVHTSADLRRLREVGVHIVMVGEQLLKQADPGAALRELLQ